MLQTTTNEVLHRIVLNNSIFRVLLDNPVMLRVRPSLRHTVMRKLTQFKGRIQEIRREDHEEPVYRNLNTLERTMMEVEELLDSISGRYMLNDNPPFKGVTRH